MQTISILGCGWLGLPLGKRLIESGCDVKGSTTTHEKLVLLSKEGIDSYLIQSLPHLAGDRLNDFFLSDILFLNIPFRRKLADPRFYQEQIRAVIKACEKGKVRWIIFASSTSVYPEGLQDVREDVDFSPDNPRSQVLFDVEQDLLTNKNIAATVIRFAGLYGGDRKLGNFIGRAEIPKSGNAPVNLIHRDDCVEIIFQIIQKNIQAEIINAASDKHPLRRELYTKAASKMNLPAPIFLDDNKNSSAKIVSNQKLKTLLNYHFTHPDPMQD